MGDPIFSHSPYFVDEPHCGIRRFISGALGRDRSLGAAGEKRLAAATKAKARSMFVRNNSWRSSLESSLFHSVISLAHV
jgi:hypothetical protein